jgi:primosomal protein N' (replication factor Y) (superfamily II helicase)
VTLLSAAMLRLTHWLADYYLCSWGQAIEAAVPAGVRWRAGTREAVFLSPLRGPLNGPLATPPTAAGRISPQQQAALEILAQATAPMTPQQLATSAGCTLAPIQALRKKKLVNETRRRVVWGNESQPVVAASEPPQLNADQQRALQAITAALHAGRARTLLLHGVTGSGKTEVYIRAIEEVLKFGRQAIVLVPEISLTPQTQQRFRSRFPAVAVLHSHQSPVERHWHWRRIANGEVQVVVGARSAVFAPIPHLGLIVLDEEHDGSFKQDSLPRYHARDVALMRCQMEQIPLVLGSATPALESYQAVRSGRYELISLPRRVMNLPLPHVQVVDLRPEHAARTARGAISRPLQQAMRQSLDKGGQIILLLNRRGFSTSIQCPACGHVVTCPDCDIVLTHHREGEMAICHYCDYQVSAPPRCPSCGFEGIRYAGLGTQRLEAEVRSRFSDVSVLRMDSDSMKKPGAHEKALDRFRHGEIQILLGTQMIAKGLDFPNVTLVGVVNADTALHLPNFRAAERTFQLVTQVAGRTGRADREGRVVVQTFSPEHPSILAASHHDYEAFARLELPVREQFQYPPYGCMVRLIVRGSNSERVGEFAHELAARLSEHLAGSGARLVGPAPTPVARIRGKFRFHLLLIGHDGLPLRQAVRQVAAGIGSPPDDIQWIADVDPLDML